MPALTLDPVDTLLLRDGRPFNQDDVGLTRAVSHFPPFPWVTAGAVRAAYARTTGWSEAQGRWQDQPPERRRILDRLGDGLFDTGDLTFDAPLLAKVYSVDAPVPDPLFPCPAHLLGRERDPNDPLPPDNAASAYVDAIAVHPEVAGERSTDRGVLAFPLDRADAESHRPLHGHWITAAALKRLLAGERSLHQPYHSIVNPDAMAAAELRIGLERDPITHRAVDGMLYSTSHRRPADGIQLIASYRIAEGSPLQNIDIGGALPLGGQGRMAMASPTPPLPGIDDLEPETLTPDAEGMVNYLILLIAPLTFDAPAGETVTGLDALPGELVASAHDRQVTFAGWNGPRSTRLHRRYWPAGTVFFFRAPANDGSAPLERIRAIQHTGLGAAGPCHTGCGRFLIGAWPSTDTTRRDDRG